MASPTRSILSPAASRVTTIIPNTTVISPRSISTRSQLEDSISTLQNEQERVQKKTFTKWINIYLSLHEPPYFINDLFEDFKDGTKLIALLEVLSGQTLPMERGKKRAHFMSNVDNALKYLESRKIKLVNIRPIDIVDGKPIIILGLVWMLILCYQIEDSNAPDDGTKDNRSKAKEALLEWVRKKTSGQIDGLNVKDFTSSWRDGLAFNALIHAIRPDLVDLRRVTRMDVRERLENAFNIAEQHLGVPRLIDAEDVDVNKPDEKSIMTYLAQFSRRFPDLPFGSINKEHGELLRWLGDTRQRLTLILEAPIRDIQVEYKEYVKQVKEFIEKQKQWKAFERKESRSPHFPGEKLKELKDSFDDITLKMNQWRFKLDTNLPGELGQIADWIITAEEVLAKGIHFDPLKLSPEENIQRFNKLNEEHAAVFTDKELILTTFQRIKRDQSIINKQISIEHLTNLSERLEIIMNTSEERGRYLDFEEIHWKVQTHFVQMEFFIIALNRKQGDINQTEKLLNEYRRKIHDEKLLAFIESLLPELSRKAQSYSQLGKKDDRISKEFNAYCENIRKTIKSAAIDLKTKEHMLQETITNWKIYHNSYDALEKWLNEGEQVLRRSSDEKLHYFTNTDHWFQIYEKLHAAIEHLISVCEDEFSTVLHNKLLFINRRWKEITESVHQFKHDESIKKKRDEFYAGRAKLLETLDKIDREMQEHLPCTTKALKEQENRLYDAQAELDMFNQTVQILSKLSQTIARESGETNASNEMTSLLQICFDKLHHVQEYIPITLKRNKIMLGHLQKFEDGLQKCQQWFNEAQQLISRYSIQVPVKRIDDSLEQHRNFFAEIGYYRSLLESKAKLIITMKKSTENLVPLNFAPIDDQYRQLSDTFEQICQQTSYWDKEFSQHSQLWKDFHQRLKYLQEWIDQAQDIVQEKHDDYAYLIQKHKNFFQTIDDEILHGFIRSGRELLHIRDQNDQKEIQLLMDTLESTWSTIVCYAPIRLLRLQYERIENIIVKELKQAEDELNEELRQLEKQRDTTDILRRHNEHFQLNNFQPIMETHIRSLHTFADDIRTKDTEGISHENEQIDQRTIKLNDYWTRMQAKIDNVKRKLQTIPKKWQEFEEKFHIVEVWMTNIERSMKDTQNTDVSFDQYKLIVNKFKSDVQQIDTISSSVKTLSSLLDDLIEERATDDPARYRQRLDTLLFRYKQLLISIEETSQQCTLIIPSKMIHENSLQLNTTLMNIFNAPLIFRDLSDVRIALQGQTKVCDVLENLSQQVTELLTRGNELVRQPMVPKYVQHDLQNIQKVYNEKLQSAQDVLGKLKRLLELWERFDANKRRYQQQTERLNNELSQLTSNRSSITSFQHEIDNCKHLRTSYSDLKSILDENAHYLQTISSNNLLPYENIQTLKFDYDNMLEEFIEKLRLIDEILQDLLHDNDKWVHFNDELKRLETLFREIGSMFDAKMFGERPLEEKQQILERIRTELGEHLHSLSTLHSDGSQLESLRSRPKDLQQVLNRLTQLRLLAETTSGKVNREEEQVAECRTHVQASHRYIQQLQPWIERGENYLTKRIDQFGALNLSDAKQLYDKHKEFLEERRRMLTMYNNLMDEEHNITDQYELKSSIKSISTRWIEIVRKSDELTPKYDKQYSAWLLFESELNSFRDQILFELEQRVNATITIDANKLFDLTRINTLLNELRLLDENIHSHASNYNRFHKQLNDLRQYSSAEGQRILHEEQMSIETRWHQINRHTTDKLRETERLYETRKSFHNRFEVFDRNIREITEQVENNGQIQTATWNQTFQQLQQIQKQLQSIQPLLSSIEQELVELEISGLSKTDLQSIQYTFDTHRQKINTCETILQKRIDLLKRYEEHVTHSTDIRTRLQQINDDIQPTSQLKVNDIDLIKSQLERYTNDLRTIQSESILLDRLMEESHTIITDSATNRNIIFVVESRTIQSLVDTVENKLVQRRIQAQELDRLVEDFSQAHTNLLLRINALSSNLRSARLLGYSPRDIEDLMVIVKTLNREIQSEETLFNTLRGKYKTLSTDLTSQERQKTEIVINKIEIELGELQEQIVQRQERLNTLITQRQELDQISGRFILWLEDKQRLISSDKAIPLKTSEIERMQKKYNDTINELKLQRVTLDNMIQLNEEVKQGYVHEGYSDYDLHIDELVRKLNYLAETLNDRNQQLIVANEKRREFELILNKLNEWIKNIEQQIKDPFTNDLQQTANLLKDKHKSVQSLLQSTKDRISEFEELKHIHTVIISTLNDADKITLDEKYILLKDKYNRLLDSLIQRVGLLDEANRERNEFDQLNQHVQDLCQQLQNEFTKLKQQISVVNEGRHLSGDDLLSNNRRLEKFNQLLNRLDETNNSFKELTRTQRLLTSKGHRIDFRIGSELNTNIKNLEGQIHNEIERIERILQTENDFHNIEKQLNSHLQISAEQLKSSQHHQDKAMIYQTVTDRLQQSEQELNKLIQLSDRLKNDIPRSQYEQMKLTIERHQERLQLLIKTCQQVRGEHEHMIKTQNKLNDDLISINDWFRKLIQEFTQPFELNLTLNNVNDLQDSMNQLGVSIDQRLARLEQTLHDESNLINLNDREIRERLDIVEELKHEVKSHLNKQRITLEGIHQRMTQYIKLTTDVKAAICEADFKLAPFFDGYDRNRLDEHEKELNFLEEICSEQTYRLVESHEIAETFRPHLRSNAKDVSDSQLRSFHQAVEDIETRIHQRRKELDEIHQKSNRFSLSVVHLQSDIARILHLIEKTPDTAENLIAEMDTTFTALQYLGRDLKKSLEPSSSSDIDRELKDLSNSIEIIRDTVNRAKKFHEENEALRDRIERTLSKIKSFTNRKRQELHESVDSGYGSVDLVRRSVEMKSFIKDVDLETSHLSEVNELILILMERKYDQQIIRSLEKKHEDVLHDLQSLKNDTTRTVDTLDHQSQEQEKLRQNARKILSILQRVKVQLIELRPTMSGEADQKITKINEDLKTNFDLFEQSLDDYKNDYGSLSEDLDKMITRIFEDMEEVKARSKEKAAELSDYNILRNEYENCLENISKLTQLIEAKTRQSDVKLNLDSLKDLTVEMQTHRSLVDRLQLLSSTLTSQLTDSNERERVRRRLNEVTRRWTELEQSIITEEEDVTEMNNVTHQYIDINSTCERWLRQTRDLIIELTNAKNVDIFDQLIPKAKTILSEYQSCFEHLQRLRNRLNRLAQANKTPEAAQKLNEIDRILKDLTKNRENLEQRLDLSQKIHFQLNEFNKQYLFYEQWIENLHRTTETVLEQTTTIDEKLQRFHDMQIELDKRKQILNNLKHDYPQIVELIIVPIQQLVANIERIKTNITRKQEECEQQNRQQKDFRGRIESLFEWIKQTHRYEPLSDKRDLESLQREYARLIEKHKYIEEKSRDVDALLRNINSSKMPSDSLQRLRQEVDHLKERFTESITELETRTKFIKKTIKDVDEQRRKQHSYQESLDKLSFLVQHDLQTPGRSVEDALKSLDEQMIKFETQNEERERRKRQREREWHLLMDEISLLQDKLNTLKQRNVNVHDSIEEQLQFIRSQNQQLDQYQDELSHLKKHGQNMCLEDGNSMPLPSEINLLQSMITFLKQQFEQRRVTLIEAERCRDIYLNECKLYEDAYSLSMERLSRPILLASTSDEYARELNEHKNLSEQMDAKRQQLNYLYDKLDRDTRTRYSKQHHDLEKRSNDLQDKMIEQTIRSEYLLRIWREYHIRLDDLCHQLDDIQKELPLNKRLLPFEQIQLAFVLYKDLKQRLTLVEPELLHLSDEIQLLCRELNVVTLQNEIHIVTENFIRIANDIREKCDYHKSATILANDIQRNLAILEETLEECLSQSRTRYDGDVNELKIQLERMMDVEKRLDTLADVYSNTITLIKRLTTYNLYDLQTVAANLENFHRTWTSIKTEVLRSENILHQNIISSLPSRQACKEMFLFIDTIKRLLDEDHGAPINNRETLQKLHKRYRDLRVDVLNHQRTIDFLNESFQQEANVDLTSIDYMENIKQINIDWIRIKSLISARIDTLEQLNDQFNEFDQTVRTLSDWVHEQTSDLEFMRSRNLEAGAKDNIKKCDEMEYQLTSKQQVLTSLKSYSGRMTSSSSTFRIIDQDGAIQNLRHMLDHLSPSIEQLKLKSKSILTDWQEYNRVLLKMEKILREAEAEIDRVETSAMNVETYEMSTRKAQEHLQAMESHRHHFEQITTHGRQLSGQCDGQTSSKINEITHRIQQQWATVEQRLHEIIKPAREVVDNWRQFNSSYVNLLDRLGELEARWYTLQREKFTSDIDSTLDKAKDFQQRLEQLDLEVMKLQERAKKLSNHLPPIAAKKIDTQYSVINNQYCELRNFQDRLIIDCNELKHREKIYLDYLKELTEAITHVQTILKSQELNHEDESVNIKQLHDLEYHLLSKRDLIEQLNSNEFILYIKRAKQLHEIMTEYSQCLELIKSRLKQIEITEYNKLNFDKRCQKWNDYIQAIEQNLAVIQENLHTNYHGLIEIDTNLSNTINDFNQRQQELIQLINEGKQIVDNQHIFIKVEQRWQNIMSTVLNKQQQVKELIKLWLSYQNYLESYYRLLKGKCELEQQELQKATIAFINQIKQGSYIPTHQNDELKNLLEKIYETNRRLITHADAKTQTILEKEWNDLQKSIHEIDINIKLKCDTLIKLLLRYNEIDRILDELNNVIKSIRSLQQQSTDDLGQFLQQCQNKNRELTQHRTELQRVRQSITEISPELHSDDTRQLIQKLNLLEIQWTDAERVLTTLIDGVTKRRFEYQDFEHKFIRFIEWFQNFLNIEMNQRIDGLTLQASLDILKNEIRNIVADKRKQVNDLLFQARLLQSQATDQIQLQVIKQKIDQLEQIIYTTEQHVDKKIKKTEVVLKMLNDFEHGCENLRSWMDIVETNLQRPLPTQNANELRMHQQSIAAIEIDIEKHSSVVSSVLALGHNLLNETDVRPRNIDSLPRIVQMLEQRWISLKELLRNRKIESETVQVSWRSVDEAIKHASKIITDHERYLIEIKRTSGDGLPGIHNEYKSLENFKRTLDDDDKTIKKITDNYSEIIRLHPTADTNSEIRMRMKDLTNRWEVLNGTLHETIKNLKYMLSVHGDFQLTQDSLALWLTDLDVLLTNLEHLSEAPAHEKIRQLDDMNREIQEKQSKIEYVQTCANYLLNKTVDARGLTINMNELNKFCQYLTNLTKRIKKIKNSLLNTSDRHLDLMTSARSSPLHETLIPFSTSPTHKRLPSPSSPRSRSPQRYFRSRDRFARSYDKIEWGDRRSRADELLSDFEDILLQINGDLRSKEESLHTQTPTSIQIENLPTEFTYNRVLTSTLRKIDALHQLIHQIKQELGAFLINDLNNDQMVLDIMEKWTYLQTLATEKDEQLNENRRQWKHFKRQLEDLEQAAQQFSNTDHLLSRTNHSHDHIQRIDEFEILLKSTIDLADQFNDHSNEWILIDHRIQLIKDKFEVLLTKTTRQHRELKTNQDMKSETLEINYQLDHLESLTHSLEPVDDNEMNLNINRTKLHRFIRIHDDLEILNERLMSLNDRSLSLLSNEQIRVTNDVKLLLGRLNSIKRVVRIYLEQLEKFLAIKDLNQSFSLSKQSPLRSSNSNLQRIYQ